MAKLDSTHICYACSSKRFPEQKDRRREIEKFRKNEQLQIALSSLRGILIMKTENNFSNFQNNFPCAYPKIPKNKNKILLSDLWWFSLEKFQWHI